MTLATAEFIRRFLIHGLPRGFHRIHFEGADLSKPGGIELTRGKAACEVQIAGDRLRPAD